MTKVDDAARISRRFEPLFHTGKRIVSMEYNGSIAQLNEINTEIVNRGQLISTRVYIVAYGDAMGLETFEPFQTFSDARERWNQVMNLIGRDDPMWLPGEFYEDVVPPDWFTRVIDTVETRRVIRIAEVIVDSNGTPTEWINWRDFDATDMPDGVNQYWVDDALKAGWKEVDYS